MFARRYLKLTQTTAKLLHAQRPAQGLAFTQPRFFSTEPKKEETENTNEPGPEEPPKQEEPKKEEPKQSGGSFFPMVLGALVLGGGTMMVASGGNSQAADNAKPETQEAKPEVAASNSVPESSDPGMTFVEITGADALEEGTMMELKVGSGKDDKVLITRYQGKLHAIGAFCSHFGAPLVNGVLFDDKVLCPWHAAGFSVTSGEIELAPGLDGVPKYSVVEQAGKHFVHVPKKMQKKQVASMAKRDPENKSKMVIIGGGAAGSNCAETLR